MSSSPEFTQYDYKKIEVKEGLEAYTADAYRAFGYDCREDGKTFLLKRERLLPCKNELTRLESEFEMVLDAISRMEKSKKQVSTVTALTTGLIGAAFLAVSMFAYLGGNMILMIFMGVIGFGIWIATYPLMTRITQKHENDVNPLISRKYDEGFALCKKAQEILKEKN